MKNLKYILVLSLLLVPAGLVNAAGTVTVSEDTTITIDDLSMDLILEATSKYKQMIVTESTVQFTLEANDYIKLVSNDRYTLTNDKNEQIICGSTQSYVHYSLPAGSSETTITFTPTATTCSGSSSSSSGGGGGGGGSSSSSPSTSSGTTSQSASKTVDGSGGGSVATSDSRAAVNIPAGLASGNVSMNIVPKASSGYTAPANKEALADQVFDFQLTSGGTTLSQFSQNVSLTFKYSDADISGLDENSLKVYYWNSSTNSWVLVDSTLDAANNTVTVEVDHFTIFGLFADSTSVSTETPTGSLIKLSCPNGAGVNDPCRSVYYLASDARRYVFPNENTYYSWYADFSNVSEVSSTEMASYAIGGNVTMRPGTYLVKITTDPKVYAVEAGGKLRWVNSEETASTLYGTAWASKIVDVPDTFFLDYDSSEATSNPVSDKHPIGSLIKYAGSSNVYYIDVGEIKRLFSGTALSNNGFQEKFIVDCSSSITYLDGANVTAKESALSTTAGN